MAGDLGDSASRVGISEHDVHGEPISLLITRCAPQNQKLRDRQDDAVVTVDPHKILPLRLLCRSCRIKSI
jgi:hypothetical protein